MCFDGILLIFWQGIQLPSKFLMGTAKHLVKNFAHNINSNPLPNFDGLYNRSKFQSKCCFDGAIVCQKLRRNFIDEVSVYQNSPSRKFWRIIRPSKNIRQNFWRIHQKSYFDEAFFDWDSFRQKAYFPSKTCLFPVKISSKFLNSGVHSTYS